MCTCIHTPGTRLFGRNLDLECAYGEEVIFCPRNYPLTMRRRPCLSAHHAILGAALVEQGFPLFYDAMNEHGLAIAGLNFPYFCFYPPAQSDAEALASFELIPFLLGTCMTVHDAKACLAGVTLCDTPFSPALPPTPLHFMLADGQDCIVIESTADGIHVYDNPVHVMTNSPAFPYHLQHLSEYMNVTPAPAVNRFSDALDLRATGCGMGGKGLPGDLSSSSRFIRAAFVRANAPNPADSSAAVAHFFRMLDFVAFPRGCVLLDSGHDEYTIYSSCMDLSAKTYYYKTYENSTLTALQMPLDSLDSTALIRYGMPHSMQVTLLNK